MQFHYDHRVNDTFQQNAWYDEGVMMSWICQQWKPCLPWRNDAGSGCAPSTENEGNQDRANLCAYWPWNDQYGSASG